MSSYEPPVGHILHSSFGHGVLRELSAFESKISPVNLMLPLFVTNSSPDALEPINALPGVSRYGVNNVLPFLSQQVEKGLRSIIIFGVDVKNTKDKVGSSADNERGPTIEAIKIIKAKYPQLWVAADVCICPFSETGHCAIFEDGDMDNQKSINRLAEIAGNYALAGADCVAPSDMMDGRIGAIKNKLRELKLGSRVAVMSYSAKFCSGVLWTIQGSSRLSSEIWR